MTEKFYTKYFVIFRILTLVVNWYGEASQDEFITDEEITDLLNEIAKVVDFKIKVKES